MSEASANAESAAVVAPGCVFVTGRRGTGKTRWLQARIAALPPAECGVVVMEEGRTRWEKFAAASPGLAVEKLFPPCICCPGLAGLSRAVRALAERAGMRRIFIELPLIATPGLLAEFDRDPAWPRELVLLRPAAGPLLPAEELLALEADASARDLAFAP